MKKQLQITVNGELRQALVEGEASGEPKPVDMTAIKAAGRKRMKAAE